MKDGATALVSGTDYDAAYSNNTSVGEATVTLTFKGNYSGTKTATFQITAKSAEGVTVDAIADQTYTGSALKPAVTVKDGETTLVSGTDYDAEYTGNTNVGTATVTLTFKGNYTGTKTANFQITAKSAEGVTVEAIESQAYTGSALTPELTVKDGATALVSGTDYDAAYSNNTSVGEATVTLTFKGNYSGTKTATFTISYYNASLIDDGDDNATVISTIVNNYGGKANVTLSGRTFFKDGHWNTICLPFDVTIAGSPLAGADVRELSSASYANGTGTLTLNFTEVTEIKAGVPYIIKWTKDTENPVINDPEFTGVTISATTVSNKNCDLGEGMSVTFKGIYAPIAYTATDKSALLVGEGSTLYYPLEGAYVNAQHAYFQLTGIEVGDVDSNAIGLRFGDATGIYDLKNLNVLDANYYDLSGRRLEGRPTETGIYIVNGKKVVVK